jgi:hypothetical protein
MARDLTLEDVFELEADRYCAIFVSETNIFVSETNIFVSETNIFVSETNTPLQFFTIY